MHIFGADPILDRAPINEGGVLQVLRGRKRVHHVFDRFLIPGCGVGMIGKHVGGNGNADQVPAVLLGLGIEPSASRRLAVQETVGLRSNDALHAFPQIGIQLVPEQPCAETKGAGPHGGLPTVAPLFPVRTFLRSSDMRRCGVANRRGCFAQIFLAFGCVEGIGKPQQRSARENHFSNGANAFVSVTDAIAPVACGRIE